MSDKLINTEAQKVRITFEQADELKGWIGNEAEEGVINLHPKQVAIVATKALGFNISQSSCKRIAAIAGVQLIPPVREPSVRASRSRMPELRAKIETLEAINEDYAKRLRWLEYHMNKVAELVNHTL